MSNVRVEGRRVDTLLADGRDNSDMAQRSRDAERGSKLLRDAIFRANGYFIPVPEPETLPPIKFKKRKAAKSGPRGKPLGWRKVRAYNLKVVRIIGIVAEHFKVSGDTLLSDNRCYEFSHPRQVAMFLARRMTSASYPDLAHQFGGRDHTTLIHAVKAVEKRIAEGDADTIAAILFVQNRLGQ